MEQRGEDAALVRSARTLFAWMFEQASQRGVPWYKRLRMCHRRGIWPINRTDARYRRASVPCNERVGSLAADRFDRKLQWLRDEQRVSCCTAPVGAMLVPVGDFRSIWGCVLAVMGRACHTRFMHLQALASACGLKAQVIESWVHPLSADDRMLEITH